MRADKPTILRPTILRPTIRDQLTKAGFKGSEPEEKKPHHEEFIQGEIGYTRGELIAHIGKSLYGKPIAPKTHKHRHGRAVIMNIKEEMNKGRRSYDSSSFKLAKCFIENREQWLTSAQIQTITRIANQSSVTATIAGYYNCKLINRKGEVGARGYLYQLDRDWPVASTAEELYLKFLEIMQRRKYHPTVKAKRTLPKTVISQQQPKINVRGHKEDLEGMKKTIEEKLKEIRLHNSPITLTIPEKIEIIITLKLG